MGTEELRRAADEASTPRERAEALAEIAWKVKYSDPALAVEWGYEAVGLAEEGGFLELVPKCLLPAAMGLLHQSRFAKAEKAALNAIEGYWNSGNRGGERSALNVLGSIYLRWGKLDQALDRYLEAQSINLELTGEEDYGIASNIGSVYMQLGDYDKALECFIGVEESTRNLEGPADLKAAAVLNLGAAYRAAGMREEALTNYEKGAAICEENGMRQGLASCLADVGSVLDELKHHEEASERFLSSLEIFEEIGDEKGAATARNLQGRSAAGSGDHERALEFFEEALGSFERLGDDQGVVDSLLSMAKSLMVLERLESSLASLERALGLATATKARPLLSEVHLAMTDVLERLDEPKRALNHLREYTELQSSLRTESAEKRLQSLEITNRVERARREAEILAVQNTELARYKEELEEMVQHRTTELESEIRQHRLSKEVRRQLEMQLGRDQRLASLGEMAGGVAHDFNNILTVISGNTEILLMDAARTGSEDEKRRLEAILKAARTGAGLTAQLLAFSRDRPMRVDVTDLAQVAEATCELLERMIGRERRLVLEKRESSLPILGDQQQLEQVLMNLVLNARDAMPSGGTITVVTDLLDAAQADPVRTSGSGVSSWAALIVSDDGEGIPQSIMDRIFDPFFTTKGPGKGTGLGLSVVHGIAIQHGGWVEVSSEPGRGSTFSVFFPLAPSKEGAGKGGSPEDEDGLRGRGQRILLVEDNEEVMDFLRAVLESYGYVPTPAGTLADALRQLEQSSESFELVFTDVMLPDGSGVELAKKVLQSFPGLPILVGSGYTTSPDDQRFIEERSLEFLQKPYDLRKVLTAISSMLEA
jgi:signal transduction histidine kinase